jgi:hypothetical protein
MDVGRLKKKKKEQHRTKREVEAFSINENML